MKKTTKKRTDQNSTENSKLEPLSDKNESNPIIDGGDEFVLFPLDVQETNTNTTIPITQNSAASPDDDFILFPLDVKKTSTNTNNPATVTNQKPNKPKRQFVTKPNSQTVKGNPNPTPTPNPVNPPKNKKLKNIFWLIVICLSLYTYNKKDSNESYTHFFSETIHKFGANFNKLKSSFINKDDFSEFKKDKKIIYSPYREFIEDENGEINEVKGDSIIIIEPTGKSLRDYYLPKGKPFKLKISEDEFTESERFATEKMELDIDQNSFENSNEYASRVSVFLLNSGLFSQEISVFKSDIRFEDSDKIEVRYMRNRIEDFKMNTVLTKYISKSLLEIETNKIIDTENNTNNKIIKTKRELRHLFFSNGGLIAYFNDGTKVGCERCDFIKSNIDRMFKKKPFEYYSNEEILNEIKENGKEGWALVDYKWNMKVPIDQNNETSFIKYPSGTFAPFNELKINQESNIHALGQLDYAINTKGESIINKIDFASNYEILIYGVGTGCQQGVMIDLRDGKVYSLPIECPACGSGEYIEYRKDSRLFINRYCQNNDQKNNYYEWIDSKKKFIKINTSHSTNNEIEKDQNSETSLYPENYSNIISEIITNYYSDLNNNNFDAEKYYAKNVDQFISIKNTNPTNINNLKNNDDYQDGSSIVDVSSISLTKNNPNNYYSCWNFNVEYECFRPSKNKYQKCNITIYLGFDENNHIVSYVEKNVRNLKFYD
jgi:hypothetical protein